MPVYHTPALATESIDLLDIRPEGTYVDLTFGGGGHSRLILQRLGTKGRLVAFDQDSDARANLPDDARLTFVESNFRFLRGQLRARGIERVDGILADLGVSSHHFDTPERGFSFRNDARLDMRMNRRGERTALEVVNDTPVERLETILRTWGELDRAGRIAACIERTRAEAPIETVGRLIEAVAPCTPPRDANKFLSKLFQALRIEVNGEMEALGMALEQSARVLAPGGRLAVISYHSLENRTVKNFLRSGNLSGRIEQDLYGRTSAPFELITRKAVQPSDEEVARNPRSRSARLRVGRKRDTNP